MRTKSPKRMEEIIDYVNQYTNHYRTSPSTREIAKAVKTDNGTVYRYLVEMNEKGIGSGTYYTDDIWVGVLRKRE